MARTLPPRRWRRPLGAALLAWLALPGGPAGAGPIHEIDAPSGRWTVELVQRVGGGTAPPALVVGLHGYGIDQSQMASLVALRPATPHVYVALRGRHAPPEGGWAWFPVSIAEGGLHVDAAALRRVADEVADLVPILATHFDADPKRVHLVGYSQGATLALHVALARPEAVVSTSAFAGMLAAEPGPTEGAPAPVLLGHGTRDPLISEAQVEATAATIRARGGTVRIARFPVPHVVDGAGRAAIAAFIDAHESTPKE